MEPTQAELEVLERLPGHRRSAALVRLRELKDEHKDLLIEHIAEIDTEYGRQVQVAGLYGQAYYGHHATPKQRRRLAYLWKRAQLTIIGRYAPRPTNQVVGVDGFDASENG